MEILVVLCLFSYLFLDPGVHVLGISLDVSSEPNSAYHMYCLPSNQPIQLKDPFDRFLSENDNFIFMSWLQNYVTESGTSSEKTLIEFQKDLKENYPISNDNVKYGIFETWGLQINNVELNDAATYKAVAILSNGRNEKSIRIAVADAPVLESEKLLVTHLNEDDGSVTLSCGRIASLGNPPIDIMWKADNGSILPALFKDGYLVLRLPANEADSKLTCEINNTSPAVECILAEDRPRWEGSVVQASKAESADTTTIIIASSVAGVVLVIIIIIIIIFIVVRRKKNGNTYNAKKQEKKRQQVEGDQDKYDDPFLKGNDNIDYEEYNHYASPRTGPGPPKPIYTDSGPYMVSNVSEVNADPVNRRNKAHRAISEDASITNGESALTKKPGKFLKKGEKKEEEDMKPPKTKPRSIFLTPSMEELDKVTEAVLGGAVKIDQGTAV